MTDAHLAQQLSVAISQPTMPWQNDKVLDTPQLLTPDDGVVECPSSLGVTFTWGDVPNATAYLVQWCTNSSFQGPTLRARRVTTNSCLITLPTDVRNGESVYWRVMAMDGSGGVSNKSTSRNFKYECPKSNNKPGEGGKGQGPHQKGGGDAKCKDANVKFTLDGPKMAMCCDLVEYKTKLSWDCKDGFGRELVALQDVEWSLVLAPGENPADCQIVASGPNHCKVKVFCKKSQNITVKACAVLRNIVTGVVYRCCATKKTFVDCDTGLPQQKPWLKRELNYPPVGLISYVHPSYCQPTLAPAPAFRSPSTPRLFPVLEAASVTGGAASVTDYVCGVIPAVPVTLVGPVIQTANPVLGSFPSYSSGCTQVQGTGDARGSVMETGAHAVFGCGLQLDTDANGKTIAVNNAHLAGMSGRRKGLAPHGKCALQVVPGCGIKIENEAVAVKNTDIAGTAMAAEGECAVGVVMYPLHYVGSIWSVVPGSLSIDTSGCCITVSMTIQEKILQAQPNGIIVAPLVNGSSSVMSDTACITLKTDTVSVVTDVSCYCQCTVTKSSLELHHC